MTGGPPLSTAARWSLAGLAGVLNGVGFIFWGPATLVANVPLLFALRGARSARQAAGLGGLVGFLGGVHIYGILDYGVALMVVFALYTASQMVVYALLMRRLWGRVHPLVDLALPALIWTLTEWIRTIGPIAMPASYVGCIADEAALRPWLAWAPILGGLGVSTLIALSQSVLFSAFAGPRHRRAAALGAVILAGAWGMGALIPPALGERPLTVVGVQGGLANAQYKAAFADPAAMRDIVATYETLSRRAYDTGADLVVWPETAVRAPVLLEPDLRARLFPRTTDRSVLVAGLLHREAGTAANIAAAITPGGREVDRYTKVRTVPRTEDYLQKGVAWRPLRTPIGRLGPIICLESVYPDAAREMVRNGAELLLVLSNDAGFGRSPITRHMTNRAIVRAVESGRWLLRVGQAGITTLIDPRGETHGRLGLFEPAILSGQAQLRDDLTLAVRWGDWWMALCAALLAALIALTELTTRRRGPSAGRATDA